MNARRMAILFARMRPQAVPLSRCLFLAAAQLLAGCSGSSSSDEKVDAGQRKYCDAYCRDSASDRPSAEVGIDLGGADLSFATPDGGQDSANVDLSVVAIDSSIPDAPNSQPDISDHGSNGGDVGGTGGAGGSGGVTGGTGGAIGTGGSNADARPGSMADASAALPDAALPDAALPDIVGVPPEVGDVLPDLVDAPINIVDVQPSPDLSSHQDVATQSDGSAFSCGVSLNASATFPAQQWPAPQLAGPVAMANRPDGTLWAAGQVFCPLDSNGLPNCSVAVGFPKPNPGTGPSIKSTGASDVFLVKLDPTTGLATFAESFGQIATPNLTSQNAIGVAVAKSGDVGLIGYFESEIDFDGNDSGGTNGTVGAPGLDFLTTAASSAYFVATFDSGGNPVHSLAVGLGTGTLLAVASNPNQDAFAVCGVSSVKATGGILTGTNAAGGGLDIVVAKIDATTGLVTWGKQFGGAGDQLCQAVSMDNSGNVIIAGGYNGTLQFGSLAAFPVVASPIYSLLYLAVLAGADGTPTAASTWGPTGKVSPFSIAVDASNNVIVAGSLGANVNFGGSVGAITRQGNTDALVVKMSVSAPTLTPIWAEAFGNPGFDHQAKSVATSSNGDIYVGGFFTGTMGAMNLTSFANTNSDGFVAHLSGADGSVLCAHRYGDAIALQEVDDLTVARMASGAALDGVAVGGVFASTITFGSTTLGTGTTAPAIFVSGLSP